MSNPQFRSYMTRMASSFCAITRRTSEALSLPLVLFCQIWLPNLDRRQTIRGTTVTSGSNYLTGWLSPQPLQARDDLHAARWSPSRYTNSGLPSPAPFSSFVVSARHGELFIRMMQKDVPDRRLAMAKCSFFERDSSSTLSP